MHSLLVSGSIGTDNDAGLDAPTFLTGFEARVGGQIGQVNTRDSIIGGIDAIHGAVRSPFGAFVEEVEGRNIASVPAAPAAGWAQGLLEGDASVFNDSFATPQVLPSYAGRKGRSTVSVDGQLVANARIADYVDYYGMPLLAGQAMTVQLTELDVTTLTTGLLNVGIYDPDGRLVATDYANVDFTAVVGQPIRFTADRPGLYRVAVAVSGDGDFNGPGGEFTASNVGNVPYELTITGGGDVGVGGVVATNNIYDGEALGAYGFFVENGDMGAFEAGGNMFSRTEQSVIVRKGSLRAISAGTVGVAVAGPILSPNLQVTRGNVGLVRSTAGVLLLNLNSALSTTGGTLGFSVPVGGDYQLVSAATTLGAYLDANRAIGVIRAGDMATRFQSFFTANADLIGDDGIIDLIDCTGDLGTLQAGGPAITTGPGGDLRYLHVGGQVFRDEFFGGGFPEPTTYAPGETVRLTDDSGAKIELEPFPTTPNPAFTGGNTNVSALLGPTLTVTGYGVRGSGGVALVNVTSTGSIRVGGGGGGKAHVQIGTLKTTGVGNPVLRDNLTGNLIFDKPTTNFGGSAASTLDVLIDGSAKVDVFKIEGSDFTSIVNKTSGEIVNIDATINPAAPVTAGYTNNGTIGLLQATSLGTAERHTGAAVSGAMVVQNVFPFNQQRNAVISGNINQIETSGGIGNLAVNGNVNNIFVNSGGRHSTGTFEGISGPLVVSQNLKAVDIGDGILASGSGNVSRAGLYVGGLLGSVTNQGLGSDVRGDIVASGGLGSVSLSNGAIIGSRVMVIAAFDQARRFTDRIVTPSGGGNANNPVFDIGSINVSGAGGIIGTYFVAASIGPVRVTRGFGIFDSFFATAGSGRLAGVAAEGYGIRGTSFEGGASFNSLSATAKPKQVSVLEYTPSVRQSEVTTIDPYFDQAPSRETDLHLYLGTSARRSNVAGVTDTGVIEDVSVRGSRDLGSVFASTIRTSPTALTPTTFSLANQIGSIQTRGIVNGLTLTTGRLKNYLSGGDTIGLTATVAGRIDNFRVMGSLDVTSTVNATGPSGSIGNFIIDGSLNGDVRASTTIDNLAVGRNIGPESLVQAKSIGTQHVRRNIFGTIKIG
jgi:hypothetical protein